MILCVIRPWTMIFEGKTRLKIQTDHDRNVLFPNQMICLFFGDLYKLLKAIPPKHLERIYQPSGLFFSLKTLYIWKQICNNDVWHMTGKLLMVPRKLSPSGVWLTYKLYAKPHIDYIVIWSLHFKYNLPSITQSNSYLIMTGVALLVIQVLFEYLFNINVSLWWYKSCLTTCLIFLFLSGNTSPVWPHVLYSCFPLVIQVLFDYLSNSYVSFWWYKSCLTTCLIVMFPSGDTSPV